MSTKSLYTLFVIIIFHLTATAQWSRLPDFVDTGRFYAFGFAINDELFVGCGRRTDPVPDPHWPGSTATSWDMNDMWSFNCISQTWTPRAPYPGHVRNRAFGYCVGSTAVVGMGYYNDGGMHHPADIWRYDPVDDTWTALSSFPGPGRHEYISFCIGTKVYVGLGINGSYYNDFWEYESTTDTWTRKADFPGAGRDGAIAFSVDGKGYIGGGIHDYDPLNDYWSYDASTDTWDSIARLPGKRLSTASTFSYDHKGYIVGGYSYYDVRTSDSVHIYDPATNTWSRMPDTVPTDLSNAYWMSHGAPGMCHSGRRGEVAFVTNGKAYTGLGQGNTDADYYKDFYEYTLPAVSTSINSLSASNATLSISPNPGNGMYEVHFRSDKKAEVQMDVCNNTGICILKRHLPASKSLDEKLDLRSFSPGIYYLRVMQDGKNYSEKMVVQ